MSIYGFGAMYDSKEDVSGDFIHRGIACVGWSSQEAPTLHEILKHIKTGDIVYIKSHPPNVGLIIKAVGIVIGNQVQNHPRLGAGVDVNWQWSGEKRFGQFHDKYAVRNLTIYEEFNFEIQKSVINLLLGMED